MSNKMRYAPQWAGNNADAKLSDVNFDVREMIKFQNYTNLQQSENEWQFWKLNNAIDA